METKTIQADKLEELQAYIKRLEYSLSNQGNALSANRRELIKALQNLDAKDKEITTHKAKIEYLEAEIAELKTPDYYRVHGHDDWGKYLLDSLNFNEKKNYEIIEVQCEKMLPNLYAIMLSATHVKTFSSYAEAEAFAVSLKGER